MNAEDIKKFREIHSLSQQALAKIVGTSIRAVQSWEQNTRNIPQSAIKLIGIFEQEQNKTPKEYSKPYENASPINVVEDSESYYNRFGNVFEPLEDGNYGKSTSKAIKTQMALSNTSILPKPKALRII